MKMLMSLKCQTLLVYFVVLTTADRDYENKLTKLWSSASHSDQRTDAIGSSPQLNINNPGRTVRQSKESYEFKRYAFKPRVAVPANPTNVAPAERSLYYSKEDLNNKHKTEILFPGDYIPIADVKSKKNKTQDSYNPLQGGPFQAKPIPLIRDLGLQRRSLDVDEEPIIERPQGFSEQTAARRSLSYILGAEEDEEEEEDIDNEDIAGDEASKSKIKPKHKKKKLSKYMLPLLMAYKLKYFALIPMMMGGLVLLVAAAGLAGFFFALFAAVMGLQKGSY